MIILGINAFHGDASAALVVDGRLVAAVEEERFNRIKHWAGFPAESIRYCLRHAGVTGDQIDHVAISFNPKANFWRKASFALQHRISPRAIIDRLRRQGKALSLRSQLAEALDLGESQLRADIHHVEHHAAHIASTFHLSPYEESAILSVDGMGDFTSLVSGVGQGTEVQEFHRVYYPHSLGFLYNVVTLYLGFMNYGDEYKVMGLAPYGEPEYVDEFRRIIRPAGDGFELNLDYFTHHKSGIAMSWENGSPKVEPFHSPLLEQRLGPALAPRAEMGRREENIAASVQAVTEEILAHTLTRLHDRCKLRRVCLAGGVAMNSVANGKITELTPFSEVYVPGGAADNGTSIGAAFHVWHQELGAPRSFHLQHALWGEAPERDACLAACEGQPVKATVMETDALIERVVDIMLQGLVVGWFRGRMEFGARALGCRSLIADPRREDMRDIINLKIKFREKFRPFAPSVLEEHAAAWFEKDEPSPFMERVLKIRPDKRPLIPAVTHVDGSGRLQTVSKETNPDYHRLISAFHARTGVPMILNTSLNENEPIVRTPKEALACLLRTRMDVIVLGDVLVERLDR
jgi:carbamoyltransferase